MSASRPKTGGPVPDAAPGRLSLSFCPPPGRRGADVRSQSANPTASSLSPTTDARRRLKRHALRARAVSTSRPSRVRAASGGPSPTSSPTPVVDPTLASIWGGPLHPLTRVLTDVILGDARRRPS